MDHDVFLVSHLIVPQNDLMFDPVRKLVLKHSGAHIGNPLLRSLRELKGRLGQELVHFLMVVVQEVSDFLYS